MQHRRRGLIKIRFVYNANAGKTRLLLLTGQKWGWRREWEKEGNPFAPALRKLDNHLELSGNSQAFALSTLRLWSKPFSTFLYWKISFVVLVLPLSFSLTDSLIFRG